MDTLTSLFDRYENVVRKNLDRCRQAVLKIQADMYTQDDYFKDATYVWLQSTFGLWGWLLDVIKPVVGIVVKKGDATATGSTEVPATDATMAIAAEPLKRVRGQQGLVEIPVAHITPTLSADRKTLTVDLNTLGGLDLRAANIYLGTVKVGGNDIAVVHLTVTP